jgi:DNA-binding PadR family transcriptional regulator
MSGSSLNATAASLLGFLHDGPRSGYDLVRQAEEVIGDFWTLTRSQVYRELAAMEAEGLIEPAGEAGPRSRRAFRLTAPGRHAFREWLETEPGPEQIRYPLLLRIAFGRHLDQQRLTELVALHHDVHVERLAAYRELAEALEGTDRYAAATLAFGIRYEQAVLEWFDTLAELGVVERDRLR